MALRYWGFGVLVDKSQGCCVADCDERGSPRLLIRASDKSLRPETAGRAVRSAEAGSACRLDDGGGYGRFRRRWREDRLCTVVSPIPGREVGNCCRLLPPAPALQRGVRTL